MPTTKTIAAQIDAVTKRIASMDVEWWNGLFQAGLVSLTALTFIFGAGALLTDRTIKRRQAIAIAEANDRAAQANVIAERERVERLKLEARLAPRRIGETAKATIVAELKATGAFAVQVFGYSDSGEVERLVHQLAETCEASGWKVGRGVRAAGGLTIQGVVVAVKKDASAEIKYAASTLVNQLRRFGIGSSLSREPIDNIPTPAMYLGVMVAGEQIRVLVGDK